MNAYTPADRMHRLAKRAMDNGRAQSLEEAEALLHGYRIGVVIDDDVVGDRDFQNALLTVIALGRRVFLGGVCVSGALDVPLLSPLLLGASLAEAVVAAGGEIGAAPGAGVAMVRIGKTQAERTFGFCIRLVFAGWRGGIVPDHAEGIDDAAGPPMALAPMLAAALAVNECFLFLSGDMPSAGRRSVGLNLWDLADKDWFAASQSDPRLRYLPARLWLIGLGHLGQAYLWGLGLLPYGQPGGLHLHLQDNDEITPSTESTSILSDAGMVGLKKSRAMASWAERRGYETTITERLFDENTRRRQDEPAIALCGLDNGKGRRALDAAGFSFVAEAGLGRGHADFRSILVHTLPGTTSSLKLWAEADTPPGGGTDAPAYRKLLDEGSLDRCGATLLAGKAVGAPFVGAIAATIVLSEVLRLLHGGPVNRLVDLNSIDPAHRVVGPQKTDFSTINPGFVDTTT